MSVPVLDTARLACQQCRQLSGESLVSAGGMCSTGVATEPAEETQDKTHLHSQFIRLLILWGSPFITAAKEIV